MNKIKKLNIYKVDSEVRHAMKVSPDYDPQIDYWEPEATENWGREYSGFVMELIIPYKSQKKSYKINVKVPAIKDPLISGMRLFQCPTGAHYKVRSLIEHHKINYLDALTGGDGSGGVGSMILRVNPTAKLIFNSLLELEGVELKGSSPSLPSAISSIPKIKNRCVNFNDVWKPSDLGKQETWDYFFKLKEKHMLNIDLVVLDMNIINEQTIREIEFRTEKNVTKLLSTRGVLIFKTYIGRLLDNWSTGIQRLSQV